MPRRALLLLTAVVLALHWLVLVGLPRGGTDQGAPQRLAFSTHTQAMAEYFASAHFASA